MSDSKLMQLEILKRLPKIDQEKLSRLTHQQAEFVIHPFDQHSFLTACPGSGKTEVVGMKAAFEISGWTDPFAGIAVLTFTRNAAAEIRRRVEEYAGRPSSGHPHFIGTFDSWLHGFVLQPRARKVTQHNRGTVDKSFRIVEQDTKAGFMKEYSSNIGQGEPIWVNEFYYNYMGECEDVRDRTTGLTAAQIQLLKANKDRFLKAGWVTYQDAEYLCHGVLSNSLESSLLARRFPIVLVDECQDLSYLQLRILHFLLQAGTRVHLVGDPNQAIYNFRKVDVKKLYGYVNKNALVRKSLTENFRSLQPIVDVCHQLSQKLDSSAVLPTGRADENPGPRCILWTYTDVSSLPGRFLTRIALDPGIEVEKSAILAKNRSLLAKILPVASASLKTAEFFASALACWNVNTRCTEDVQNAMQQTGRFLSKVGWNGAGNSQAQYCPFGINHSEWRIFLSQFLQEASDRLWPFQNVTWSKWLTGSVKPFLKGHWEKLPGKPDPVETAFKRVISPQNKADELVTALLAHKTDSDSGGIRITTIHNVKGETLDAVLLVSASNRAGTGGGRYFTDWLGDGGEDEFVRLAYVASSRPRTLLIWAIPSNAPRVEIGRVIDLGFTAES